MFLHFLFNHICLLHVFFCDKGRGFAQYSAEAQESSNRVVYKDTLKAHSNGKVNGTKAIITAAWGLHDTSLLAIEGHRHQISTNCAIACYRKTIEKWNHLQFTIEEVNLSPDIS